MKVSKSLSIDESFISFFLSRNIKLNVLINEFLAKEIARIEARERLPTTSEELKRIAEERERESQELLYKAEELKRFEREERERIEREERNKARREELLKLIAEKEQERNATINKEELRQRGYQLMQEIRKLREELNGLNT